MTMKAKKLDIELFIKIRDILLPNDTSVNWLRYQDFGNSFRRELPENLFKFEENYDNPNFEFLNPTLEFLKIMLENNIENFTNLLASKTFPQGVCQTVPPEWEKERPQKFESDVKVLNDSSKKLVESYDNFIKTGRRILKITTENNV